MSGGERLDEPGAPPAPATSDRSGVLFTVAYDGAAFSGFAPQPGQRTIHGELLRALRAVDPSIDALRGASRTDAGVHARGQRVAFDPARLIPPKGWALAVRPHLAPDLAVVAAARVGGGFTPRFEAQKKHYRYTLLAAPVPDPFLRGRAWRVAELSAEGCVEGMRREASSALGTHDFAAFRSSADERVNTVRALSRLDVSCGDGPTIHVDVEGDGFLHNMVRILVGTLVDVGTRRLPPGAFARALSSGQRRDLGRTAPADGLCLERIWLADEGEERWPTSP